MHYKMLWPEVITNPDFEYGPVTKESRMAACAHGLTAWAAATLDEAPENFGYGMIKIATFLGMKGVPDGGAFMAYSKQLRRNDSPLAVLGW